MAKSCTRIPSRKIGELLPKIWLQIQRSYCNEGELICQSWKEISGPKIAQETTRVVFERGVIKVTVTSSTLVALLTMYEKQTLLKQLRSRFPRVVIQDLMFRLG